MGKVGILGILGLCLVSIGDIASERLSLFCDIFMWEEKVKYYGDERGNLDAVSIVRWRISTFCNL